MKQHSKNTSNVIFAVFTIAAILAFSPAIAQEIAVFAQGSNNNGEHHDQLNNGELPTPETTPSQNGLLETLNDSTTTGLGGHGENEVYGPNPDEANGVHYRQQIDVPFDPTGVTCDLNEAAMIFTCFFYGGNIEDLDVDESVLVTAPSPVEEFGELNSGEGTPKPPVIPPDMIEEEPKSEKQTAIDYLQNLQDEGRIMPSEREVLRLLLDAQQRCEFGVDEGEAIQHYQYFDIPKSDVDITRSFNYDRNHLLSSIAKLIESCDTWSAYKGINLGPEYTNKISADKETVEKEFKRLGDLAALSFQYDVLTDHDFIEATQEANKAFCDSPLYGNHTKANYGCINVGEAPNRGGYSDVSENSIYKQYLESKETGINVVNPDETPASYVSPIDNARSYIKVYGYIPVEVAQQLTADEIAKLLEEIKTTQGEQ